MNKPNARDNYAAAISLFERALVLDPNSVEAQSRLARALVGRVFEDMTSSRAADIGYAEEMVERALAQFPNHPHARYVKGQLLRWQTPLRRSNCRIRNLARVQSKLLERLRPYRAVQVAHRLGGGGDPAISASHPSQPPRSQYFRSVLGHRGGTSLTVTNRRLNSLVRKSAQRQSGVWGAIMPRSPPPMRLRETPNGLAFELSEARRLSGDDRYSSIAGLQASGIGISLGWRPSVRFTRPLISPVCAKPVCRRSDRQGWCELS